MRSVLSLYLLALAYAVVRYVVFSPQNLQNIPVFVVNKALSMAAALCFVMAFWQQWRQSQGQGGLDAACWFRAGTFGACAHVPLSLAILRPGYFKEFFAGDRLSLIGEIVFLCGALTLGGIYLLHRTSWTPVERWRLSLATTGLLCLHTLSMGVARGFNINRSHAYLPPMWLLSLLATGLGLGLLLLSRPRPAQQSDS